MTKVSIIFTTFAASTKKTRNLTLSRWLVKYRKALFITMTVLAIVCALAVPSININTDMTRYLPHDYPMKPGLDLMETQLPALQEQMQEYGTLFADGADLLPTDLPQTLAIGVGLLFLVLLVMCSSVMEVGLFLLTTIFAVILNMGTNALLPSVAMITNTLTPVLQMVLSMDYSIILMNRYRQEKSSGKDPETAMQAAIGGSASSILSSALTTIVSLMMLCFIKLKIGADLGVVLSKGVSFSLLCNFTVLPFLILAFDKAVEATRKKVPVFPALSVSRFTYRFRYPLMVLLLLIFAGFAYLQRGTSISFSPQWNSTALSETSSENAALLIYPNSLEANIPDLMDTLSTLPGVQQALSYPSLVQRRRTVKEMTAFFGEFAPENTSDFPTDLLSLVYYARFTPERTERMSLSEMMDLVDELSAQGLVPEGYDLSFDMDELLAQDEPGLPEPELPNTENISVPVDTLPLAEGNPQPLPQDDSVAALPHPNVLEEPPVAEAQASSHFTYEEASTAWNASEMARLMQFNERQISMLYRMAGRRDKTMTPKEMLDFVQHRILSDQRYSMFVSKEMAEQVVVYRAEIDSILAAGPAPASVPLPTDTLWMDEQTEIAASDSSFLSEVAEAPADSLFQIPDEIEMTAEPPVEEHSLAEPPVAEGPPTPLEVLAEMAFSSMRYSSGQIHAALTAAGFSIPRDQLDLLFLYAGARNGIDSTWSMSPEELLDFVADTLLADPALGNLVPDSARAMITDARAMMLSGVGQLRGESYSGAVLLSDYPPESDSTFAFVDRLRALSDLYLPETHYWIGESEMYKELKDGFPRELLLLTLLTVLSIYLIVAINFRSIFIPIPLVMTIMSGVYVNIWASGLGGNTMYYLSYLIIQGILMGATIDYTILFTHSYLSARNRQLDIPDALAAAYRGASHSILTSGLILIVVPFVMSLVLKDPMIASILWSLAIGAFAIVTLILFVLPGVIAALNLPSRKPASHPLSDPVAAVDLHDGQDAESDGDGGL